MKEILIQNRKCRIFAESKAEYILIHPTGQHEIDSLETEYEMLKSGTERDFALVSFEVKNWNDELSPWKAKQVFGDELFGDRAESTLQFITDELIPSLQEYMNSDTKIILGGYSLAGLFSLWSAYQTGIFHGVAACSPSVWLENWIEFAKENTPLASNIYLSIGNKEHKTRNPMLRNVKNNIEEQYEILRNSGFNTVLEINSGNHFQDNTERLVKGFLWCIEQTGGNR